MTHEQAVAYVHAQAVAASAAIAGMVATNMQRQAVGASMAYDEAAFSAVTNDYCISHNAVIQLFQEHP